MKKFVVFGALALAIAALALWFIARPAYRRHQERKAVATALDFMAKGERKSASLSARQALQINPRNVEACQIMADLSDLSRSPAALDWRRRIAETAPTVENKLRLAATALRSQEPPFSLAAQILEEIKDSGRDLPAYHTISGELALKLKRPGAAATHFETASRLEPTNELHQLNLAVLRLQSTNAETAARSRANLDRLRASPVLGAVALRWLVAESIRTGDITGAERFSRELLGNPHTVPDDRLQHLSILQESKNPDLSAYLVEVQKSAATNAAQVYSLAAWMVSHGKVNDTLSWLTNVAASVRNEQPAPLAFVDYYLAKQDWSGLQSFLEKQKWGELEFLRFAFLSRAATEQRQTLAGESHWRSAVREAGDRLGPLTSLLGLAGKWGRAKSREDLLWQIGQRFPRQKWTFAELERLYAAADNTSGLNKLASAKLSYNSQDFRAQNDLAATSLLLKLNMPRAHDLAKQAYEQHPEEPVVASTYAFSLHLQRRTKEGLGVLEKLKPEVREAPPVVLYYGLLLIAAGQTNQAAKYLDLAQGSRMLPEERALLAGAGKN